MNEMRTSKTSAFSIQHSAFSFILFLAFAFQGTRGLWEPDEGSFATVAGEMSERGDWLLPTLNHQPYPEKPPLLYWGMMAGMDLFGHNEWGARAFNALCFCAHGWFCWTARQSALGRARRHSSLHHLCDDATAVHRRKRRTAGRRRLTMCTTAAYFCFWQSVTNSGACATLWKLLMCAAFGVGFLAKGPAALIPSAPMFVFLILTGKTLRYFLTPWAILGALIFAGIRIELVRVDGRQCAGGRTLFRA